MPELDPDRLAAFQARRFRLGAAGRLRSVDDALAFVNARGFVYFWPIKGVTLPSLWAAVAGDRPVADAHDDPGHVTWGWKDQMLSQRRWYYAKLLRGKATMVSLEVAPFFYALSDNFGDPENDYRQLYEEGRLSREARLLYETLLRDGPLDTVTLRRRAQLTSKASNSPFNRAMTTLQKDWKILPVGVAEAGAWRYSHVYDLVHRHFPDLPGQARPITRGAARRQLLRHYFAALGAATAGDVRKLFQWRPRELEGALAGLVDAGELVAGYRLPGQKGTGFVSAELAG